MRLLIAAVFTLSLTAPAIAADPPAKKTDVATAVKNGIAYLDEYGANWMESRKCASCHHLAQTVWVLSEAKAAGYKVDEKFLADVAAFIAAPDGRARIFPDPSDKRPEAQQLNGGLVYALLAFAAIEKPTKEARELQVKAVKHIVDKQEKDGSWPGGAGASPPVFDCAEVRFGEATAPGSIARDGIRGERFDAVISCLASRTGVAKDAWAVDHRANLDALAAAQAAGIPHFIRLRLMLSP